MTSPTIIHRYEILAIEAVQALVDIGDCREVRISLDGGMLVVDVIAPAAPALAPTVEDMASITSNEAAKSNAPSHAAREARTEALAQVGPDIPDANQGAPAARESSEPELKGGPLARRAAILCGMGGFQAWLDVATANLCQSRGLPVVRDREPAHARSRRAGRRGLAGYRDAVSVVAGWV